MNSRFAATWPRLLAAREFRAHPSRLVAAFVAIVISVGFLVATQVSAATETHAVESREALYASRADVVVQTHLWHSGNARLNRQLALMTARGQLAADPDVIAVAEMSRLHTELICGEKMTGTMLTTSPADAGLRWFTPIRGRLPVGPAEVVLTTQTAHLLGADLGTTVIVNWPTLGAAQVVGITADEGYADPPTYVDQSMLDQADHGFPPPAYGVVVNPKDTEPTTPGSSGDGIGRDLLVRTRPGTADAVAQRTQAGLTKAGLMKIYGRAVLAAQVRADVAADVGARPDLLGQIVTGSALVAVCVGALIISTTFSILVAQRRREVGMLRALGASPRQVRSRFLPEALTLAAGGALVGAAAGTGAAALIAAVWTHSLQFGLVVPWARVAACAGVGFAATAVAALIPIHVSTRVHPLEAMQPVVSSPPGRVALRAVTGLGLGAAGAAAVVVGLQRHQAAWAVGGVVAVTAAVLLGARSWVPVALRALAAAWPRRSPVPRLGFNNAARSPSRVGTTAAALVLAVLLIALVQTGTASARSSAFAQLDRRFPVDVAVLSADANLETGYQTDAADQARRYDAQGHLLGFAPDALDKVRSTPGVSSAAEFATSEPVVIQNSLWAAVWLPLAAADGSHPELFHAPLSVGPGEIGLPQRSMERLDLHPGDSVHVSTVTNQFVDLRVVECNLSTDLAVVQPDVITTLQVHSKPGLIVARLADPDAGQAAIGTIQARLAPAQPGLKVSGASHEKQSLQQLLDGITAIVTGMLGIAAAVALVGVTNTLGLSALERARENALLRALGLPRRGLWELLLAEALAITAVSIVAGLALGIAGGYAVARALAAQLGMPAAGLHTDAAVLGGAGALVVLAGALAAVLPARQAARVSPVAALADAAA